MKLFENIFWNHKKGKIINIGNGVIWFQLCVITWYFIIFSIKSSLILRKIVKHENFRHFLRWNFYVFLKQFLLYNNLKLVNLSFPIIFVNQIVCNSLEHTFKYYQHENIFVWKKITASWFIWHLDESWSHFFRILFEKSHSNFCLIFLSNWF